MSTTITVFHDVSTPSTSFTTTIVSRAKEELGPGWAVDDVYPPLAELRRALLTDEEWAAMSSWEKDVWEMYYRPDWERLACIEQILVDTPAAQREERHQEILEALRNLGASATKFASVSAANSCIVHLDTSHVVPVDTAPTAIEEDPEVAWPAVTDFITITPVTCSTEGLARDRNEPRSAPAPTTAPMVHTTTVDIDPLLDAPAKSDGTIGQAISGVASTPTTCLMVCLPRYPETAPVLVASPPPIPNEYIFDTINICVAAVPVAMTGEFRTVLQPTVFTPTVQMQPLYNDSESCMPITGHCITSASSVLAPPECVHDTNTILVAAVPLATMGEFPAVLAPMSGQLIASKVPRPMPWPSFMELQADGVESRPWPWPSFGKIGCEFPSNSVEKAFGLCISDGSNAKEPEHYFCSCQPRESSILNSVRWSVSSHDQFSCPIQDASYWPGYFVTGSQMNRVVIAASRCSHWLVSCICDGPAMISPFNVVCAEWVLPPWDSGQQAAAAYDQFSGANWNASCWHDYIFTGVLIQGVIKVSVRTVNELQDAYLSQNWQFVYSAIGQGALFILIQSIASDECSIHSSDKLHETWQYFCHTELNESVYELLGKMFRGWNYMDFAIGIVFSYLSRIVVCHSTWQNCYLDHILFLPHIPRPACQDLHRTISLADSCSPSDATVILLSFDGQTHPLGLLWQGDTRTNLPSLFICKLKLQNHQKTMHMKKVGLPRFHAFVWHVGKCYLDWKFAHLALARVQSVLLHVHAYQLASTMFSFAWGNLTCISLILTAQGISVELLNRRPSKASGYYSLVDCCSLVNTLKKHPLPWDPGGKRMTSLDRHMVVVLVEESGCLVWISSDLHTSVSLADSGSLGWGCQEAVSMKLDQNCHYIWSGHALQCSMTRKMELLNTYLIMSSYSCLLMDKRYQEGSYAMIPLIRGDTGVCNVALSAASQEVQLHIPWDPGGSELLCLQLWLGVNQVVTQNLIQLVYWR